MASGASAQNLESDLEEVARLSAQWESEADKKTEMPKAISETKASTEAEIPVLSKIRKDVVTQKSSTGRLLISLGIVILVAAGLMLFARQWAKRKSGLKQHHQIRVLTQYPLGPKKGLAIIRVAGESILIGVTDHNISMIKSLSIIDEELPSDYPENFGTELAGAQSLDFDPSEIDGFELGPIRDRVTKTGAVRSN